MGWRTREAYDQEERERLAAGAARAGDSLGRVVPEPEHAYRTAFQRDRDRIVHSRAFRRLEFKTQVFVHVENDHYRNRLTHTIEAAQVARTVARALRLNEDLAEAIVLAHDLGHTPFGHAGEAVLAELMKDDGGFDHNRQSLRVVDVIERRYPGWSGLNLTMETREGILKYGAPWPHPLPLPKLRAQRSLEAQVANHADEIAYLHHDLDDGLRSGLVAPESLAATRLWQRAEAERCPTERDTPASVVRSQTVGALGNALVTDLVEDTSRRLDAAPPASPAAVRERADLLVGFSPAVEEQRRELKRFLYDHFYHHPHVQKRTEQSEWVMGDLFRAYRDDPSLLPEQVRADFDREGRPRAIADYIAGMTDRFAMDEHQRLRGVHGPVPQPGR